MFVFTLVGFNEIYSAARAVTNDNLIDGTRTTVVFILAVAMATMKLICSVRRG